MKLISIAHFMVDLTCAFLVANIIEENIIIIILLYNFCAFALQMPFGVLLENNVKCLKLSAVGIFMVLLSLFIMEIPILAIVVAGVGNALFHLGGGLWVMNRSAKAGPLGVFIAPGAMGIYIGGLLGISWGYVIFLAMITIGVLIWKKQDIPAETNCSEVELSGKKFTILTLFMVVVIRGFIGMTQVFEWKSEFSFAFVVVVVLGKMIGGYLSDMFGAEKVGKISLLISMGAFLFYKNPFLGLLGVLTFQITMPITLWFISKITYKGFGFGLLTFALFIGALPTLMGFYLEISIALLVLVSFVLFCVGIKQGDQL